MTDSEYLARLLLFFRERAKFMRQVWEPEMSKTSSITDLIEAGIRAESLRQKAIANNIANLKTPGYRRIDVKFEEFLAKALDSPGSVDLNKLEAQIHRPEQTPVKSNGNDVHLESEVGEMVKNSLRHTAYIRLLRKKYSQIELAISVGRK